MGNRLLVAIFTLALAASVPASAGSHLSIESATLEETRTIYVHLPAGYESSEQAFPVLYFLDAPAEGDPQSKLDTVAGLRDNGVIPDLILVGICNTARNRDMIPIAVSHRPGSGGSDRFLDFIAGELKPFVEKNYRTNGFDILNGESNAGLLAVYAFVERPELFDAYVASSPMIGHCPDLMFARADEFIARTDVENKKLFMIYGEADSPRATGYIPDYFDVLSSGLSDTPTVRVEKVLVAGAGHVPPSSLHDGLLFVFSD
jgi:predicted alpha/beta superfamily hydrolase